MTGLSMGRSGALYRDGEGVNPTGRVQLLCEGETRQLHFRFIIGLVILSFIGFKRRPSCYLLSSQGSLQKLRGLGQTRTRWFSLTTSKLMYYTENTGDLISSVNISDIVSVTDLGNKRFRVATREPFGASKTNEMLLEASSQAAKAKVCSV
jgi:hypothetical protein